MNKQTQNFEGCVVMAAVLGFDTLTFDLNLAVTLSYLTISRKDILESFSET